MSRYIDTVKAAEIVSEKYKIPLSDLVDTFAEVPPADVREVKHGQWSWYRISEDYIYIKYACSQCHYTNQYATEFCPHCGAQMDEEAVKE